MGQTTLFFVLSARLEIFVFVLNMPVVHSALALHLSRLVGKPKMWFPNRSDTNRPVQAQKRARSLKFRL